MKLTSKKLKQMIREAMGSYTESEQGVVKPSPLPIKMTPYDMMPPVVKSTINQVRAAGFDVGRKDGIYNHYEHIALTPLIYIVPKGQKPMTDNYVGMIRSNGRIDTRKDQPELERLDAEIELIQDPNETTIGLFKKKYGEQAYEDFLQKKQKLDKL